MSHESVVHKHHGATSANKLALHRHSKMVVSKLERNNRNAKGNKRKSTVGGIAVAAACEHRLGGNILK